MGHKKWVQHISGQGEKWLVVYEFSLNWKVASKESEDTYRNGDSCYFIPKSEYRPCDPPELWEDVTGTVEESPTPGNYRCGRLDIIGMAGAGEDYRLTKMLLEHGPTATRKWAFIVEKRKP